MQPKPAIPVSAEDKLEYARRFYNTSVRDYNISLQTFPRNFLASTLGFKALDFLETDEADREVPKVSFDSPTPSTVRRSRLVHEQISRNKRLAIIYVVLFLCLWLAIGALVGWIFAVASGPSIAPATGVRT